MCRRLKPAQNLLTCRRAARLKSCPDTKRPPDYRPELPHPGQKSGESSSPSAGSGQALESASRGMTRKGAPGTCPRSCLVQTVDVKSQKQIPRRPEGLLVMTNKNGDVTRRLTSCPGTKRAHVFTGHGRIPGRSGITKLNALTCSSRNCLPVKWTKTSSSVVF